MPAKKLQAIATNRSPTKIGLKRIPILLSAAFDLPFLYGGLPEAGTMPPLFSNLSTSINKTSELRGLSESINLLVFLGQAFEYRQEYIFIFQKKAGPEGPAVTKIRILGRTGPKPGSPLQPQYQLKL